MVAAIIISLTIATIASFFWVRGIDASIQYEKDHPDADPDAGWLNWDKSLNDQMNRLNKNK